MLITFLSVRSAKNWWLTVAMAMGLLPCAAVGQCFECTIDPSCFGGTYPVLCPSAMPDAVVGEYYEESATFHLPPIVLDPGSGLTVDFLSMTVMTVEACQLIWSSPPTSFQGNTIPSKETYMGARWFAALLESGLFSVDLMVEVVASAFGVEKLCSNFSACL